MADIAAITPQERFIDILHPVTEKPVGLRVGIMSISDPRMKRIKRKIQDEKLRLEARGKNFKSADIEENSNSLIVSAMTFWEWYNPTGKKDDEGFDPEQDLTFKGKKPEFNEKNATEVLQELSWVADQISEEISNEKAFFS